MRTLVDLFSGPSTRDFVRGAAALIVLAVVAANLLARAVPAADPTVTGSISSRSALPAAQLPAAEAPRTGADAGVWARVTGALAALR
ncbi:hypothetical protein [Prosthecodimorpha staleyi]|uniref:Uncharacterized protein n=1 Tax=Prosthecodimorpha staleyi TaxID=2840188 RepID=A0A947GD98_9HYPH|nr:hypothetical protein [Prosthecodimorpha staleyi]MBT9290627.1 hypothetical protein [Prosthecodimorpha staleyi]